MLIPKDGLVKINRYKITFLLGLPSPWKNKYRYSYFYSLSSLVKSTENGNGVTFRSGADVTMDISVSGFGVESPIDRAMQMVKTSPCPPPNKLYLHCYHIGKS